MRFCKLLMLGSMVLIFVILMLPGVGYAQAQWSVYRATDKIFKTSIPSGPKYISLEMAKGEYEGVQIVLRPATTLTRFHVVPENLSATGGFTIEKAEISTYKVGYINITQPSRPGRSATGYYPDPLIPINGSGTTLFAGVTQPVYVLFHVPSNAQPATYSGNLSVRSDSDTFTVNVTIKVINVSVANPRLQSCFPIDMKAIQNALPAGYWGYPNAQNLMAKYYAFFKEHRISPDILWPGTPTVYSNGNLTFSPPPPNLWKTGNNVTTPYLSDYLGSGTAQTFTGDRLNLNTTRLPFSLSFPYYWSVLGTDRSRAVNYLRQLVSYYSSHNLLSKSFLWYYDEPKDSECGKTGKVYSLASLVHSINLNIRFMLTKEPRPATSPLWSVVDIWVTPLQYCYKYLGNLSRIRSYGAEIWGYNHSGAAQVYSPSFLIDKKFTDERYLGWFAYKENLKGILHWSANNWASAYGGTAYRNPYRTPLSYVNTSRTCWANGEASLFYPGYSPADGLSDPAAGPVSSLRLEALRDGIEDNELLSKLSDIGGQAYGKKICDALIKYRYGNYSTNQYINFPYYQDSPATLEYARKHLIHELSRRLSGNPNETRIAGKVVNKATGKGVFLAKVSNGLFSTKTNKYGNYLLTGLIPESGMPITVIHPEYKTSTVYVNASEGQSATTKISLSHMRNDRLLLGFEQRALNTRYWKGDTPYSALALYAGNATQGVKSLKAIFTLYRGYASVHGRLSVTYIDFSPYKSLEFDVSNPYPHSNFDRPWMLTTVLKDVAGRRSSMRHFLEPKAYSHTTFNLASAVKQAGFNIKRVQTLQFTLNRPGKSILYIDNVRLTPKLPRY